VPYRKTASEIARGEAVVETGPLLRLDASGRRGRAGADGHDGRDGVTAGSDGDRGGDASPAEPGEPAGRMDIELRSVDASDTRAHVAIDLRSGAEGQRRGEAEVDFARAGEIELVAVGGRGGNGGDGGRGGHGARGRAGADATRWSSGDDGGPGGDGGDGGSGSSGAAGGGGGAVVIRLSEHDTPLLLLVRNDVRGGEGGAPGENGGIGRGGPGGRGGSSYSWTESESYRDANGNHRTRTTHHSKSGGSSGRPGRNGRPSSALLYAGKNGAPGSVKIEVRDDAGTTTSYRSRYDIRLVSFQHRNANDDGIYEPEEKVFVSRVAIQNTGGMPLPKHHDVIVRIADDGWIAPVPEQTLVLPRSLAPGEIHVFEREELELTLRMFRPQKAGPPLAAPETIHLLAELPRVRRRFGELETPGAPHGNIVIRFPIEVSEPTALFSLAPGQATRIRWRLTNVSGRPFGLASEQGRAVGVRLVLDGGEIRADGVHLFARDPASTEERLIALDHGLDLDVPHVDAGQEIPFEATIAVPHDAAPYTTARFVVSAELGHIADPRRARAVHLQEIRVCVGRPFDARGADVLLVVNNRTVADEVAAWEELVRASGLTVSVWDAALEGGVAVLRDVAAGAHSYRLVVILNNRFDTPAGERLPSVLIEKSTSMALARHGTHVLYVGRAPDLAALLVPTDGENPELAGPEADDDTVLAACANAAIGEAAVRFQARSWFSWPWTEPNEQHLARRARTLSSRLARAHPDRRYVVVHDFAPVVERRVAWLRRVILGSIEVRRSFDVAPGAVASIQAEAENMHAPAFVRADVTFAATLRALPFPAKLQLLDGALPFGARTPHVPDGCPDAIIAAVLGDLVREQDAASEDGWRRSPLAAALPLLMTLERTAFASAIEPGDGGPRAARLVELIAWLDLVARDHPRFWEWLPPFSLLRRRPQLRRVVRASLVRLVARVMGAGEKATWRAITERRKELRRSIRRRRKQLELASSSASAFVHDRLAAAVLERAVSSDVTVLPRTERNIDKRRHDDLRAKDISRSERAASVATSAANARANLLREESCEELLARALPRTRVAPDVLSTNEPTPAEAHEHTLEGSAAGLAELREHRRG